MHTYKRSFLCILALFSVLMLIGGAVPAAAETQTFGSFVFVSGDGGITITDYTGAGTSVTVPDTINALPVIAIGDEAFRGCENVKEVVLPDSVTSIGTYAFSGCDAMTGITLPDTVTAIGAWAFYNCSSLTAITIPSGLKKIEDRTFSNCLSLDNVTIPSSVTDIGNYAFHFCRSLSVLTVPASVKRIGSYSFYHCSGLKTMDLPWTLETLGEYAFFGCSALEMTVLPPVAHIPQMAFGECGALQTVALGDGTLSVDAYAFYRSPIKLINLPDTITHIENHAFYGAAFSTVTLPKHLVALESCAFGSCTDLTAPVIPDSVRGIATDAFIGSGCMTDSANWLDGCFYLNNHLILAQNRNATTLAVRAGTVGISPAAAAGQLVLDTLELPDSIQYVGADAFIDCPSLKQITLNNMDAVLENHAFGYMTGGNAVQNLTLVGLSGSTLAAYAISNHFAFETFQAPWQNPFSDVVKGNWFYAAVRYAATNALFNGTSKTTFSPMMTMNRGMLATVLFRSSGEMASEYRSVFSDVPDDVYYTDGILWAYAHNVVNGVGNNRYAPDDPVTRQDIAVILFRFAKNTGRDTDASGDLSVFRDSQQISGYATEAMRWAVGCGLIQGNDSCVSPKNDASRAEVATILMRFFQTYSK